MKRGHCTLILLTVLLLSFSVPSSAEGATVAERTAGRILLDVEHSGEAWYVYPVDLKRYYLGRPADAFEIMKFLSLGITNVNLAKIPQGNETWQGDLALRQRLSGRILLQVEENGEAWYVHTGDLRRYYLGRPTDAFNIMTRFGLGATSQDLSTIPIGVPSATNAARYSSYTLTISRGSFAIDVIQLRRDSFAMVSDTGDAADCDNNCSAQSLAAYASENAAQHGIHGSYFCPPDYSACAGKTYSFLPPFFNSALDTMINNDALPFHAGPMIAADTAGGLHYFHRTIDFGYSVSEFEQDRGVQLAAAASNYPSLVEGGNVIVTSEPLESGMYNNATRGAIGYNDTSFFLVIARSADMIDLAYIMQTLGARYAMNLDGGGSIALLYENQYRLGPGRQLPNVVVFKHR